MLKMAVEVGGTFTDLVWMGGDGLVRTHKVPSTPGDPSGGVIQGLEEALGNQMHTMTELFHGSTIATNAVLERKGCRAGLVTTKGFRDLLVIQRQTRPNVYAVALEKPAPLVPLNLVSEVRERIDVNGQVLVPLDEEELLDVAGRLLARGIESLAICFLHAYQTPLHEERARVRLRERFPDLPVVLSSEVLPTFREYERMSTTVMAAYLAPLVNRYLGNLEAYMKERASRARLFIMQSSGGVVPSEGVRTRPVDMLQSGPAAGVIASIRVGALLGDGNLITLDVGGTSTDVCLVTGGAADVVSAKEVDGLPVGMPSVDIVNVGAGGGSLGYVDAGGMLQVGPQSAGARPGPACYGHGGTEPAVTDALVHLGWIRPRGFLGGRMPLDADRADSALAKLAGRLGQSVERTAQGMVDVAVAHIDRCMRLVSVQRGYDPKGYVIYAYGGMGPVVGALVAQEMKVARVVVPPHPGLFSALGLLLSDLKRVYQKTAFTPVTRETPALAKETFTRMAAVAEKEFAGYGYDTGRIQWERSLELRYRGQGFELPIALDLDRLVSEGRGYLDRSFHDTHRARYGTTAPTDDIELVNYRLVARVPSDWDALTPLSRRSPSERGPRVEMGSVLFAGEKRSCPFLWRESLPEGHTATGLAIVEEPTATTVVPAGWRMTVGPAGSLILSKEAHP
jgi:N-methylhydantoinase A